MAKAPEAQEASKELKEKQFKTKDIKIADKAQEAGCHPVGIRNAGVNRKTGGNLKEYTFIETPQQVETAIAGLEIAKE